MRSHVSPRSIFAFAALALTFAGCAGAGGAGGSSGSPRGSSTRIVADELDTVAELDLYAAISRLRPTWLRSSGRRMVPGVIVDGTPQSGGVDALRSFRASQIGELRLMSASDATTRYGTGYSGGAIVVTTRR